MWNVCFVLSFFIFFLNQNSYAKEVAGEIVSVSGIAFIRPDKSTGAVPKSPPKAKPGDNVYVGDVINTSSEGAVKILMKDKSIVDIGASSLFKVDEYLHNNGNNRKAKLDLMFGKVRVAVTKKIEGGGSFQVKTKGATMGVRGTEFVVKEDVPDRLSSHDKSAPADAPKTQKTEVTVIQGKVDVAAPAAPKAGENANAAAAPVKTVSLTAGTQLTTGAGVAPGAAMAPVKLSETQLSTLKTETKIVDNTFAKAVTIEPMSTSDSDSNSNSGRSPSSQSSSSSSPLLALSIPPLPPVVVPTILDVPGFQQPSDVFAETSANTGSGMKNLRVTIITSAPAQ